MRHLPANAVATASTRALDAIERERARLVTGCTCRVSGLPTARTPADQPAFNAHAQQLDAARRPIERLRDLALWYRGHTIPVDDASLALIHAHYPLHRVA